MSDTSLVQEREAAASAPRLHMEADAALIDVAGMDAEAASYAEPGIEPQWMQAYKLFTDEQGEYGIPYPVPVGQFFEGANALVKLRRIDGGRAWTSTKPPRLAPQGTIECIADRCGDAHIGGKRKMLPNISALIEHVEAFHERDAKTYRKYLDQLADQLAMNNPRLQRLMDQSAAGVASRGAELFYCQDDDCTEAFATQKKLDAHRKEAGHA